MAWFPVGVRYRSVYGTVDTAGDGEIAGAALWLPPEKHEMTAWRMLRRGMLRTPRILGAERFQRINGARHALDASRNRLMPTDASTCGSSASTPRTTGGGRAATIGIGLARADATGKPAYLETYRERNLAFYVHHGFDVVTARSRRGPAVLDAAAPGLGAPASGTSAATSSAAARAPPGHEDARRGVGQVVAQRRLEGVAEAVDGLCAHAERAGERHEVGVCRSTPCVRGRPRPGRSAASRSRRRRRSRR